MIDKIGESHDRRARNWYMEMMEYRTSARGHLIALENKSTMEEYLEEIINGLWNVSLFRNAHGDGGQTAEFAVDGSDNTPF